MKRFFSLGNTFISKIGAYLFSKIDVVISWVPESLRNKFSYFWSLWKQHIVLVVFFYTILRLLLFMTFSFRFEFLLGFGFLIGGVFILEYLKLKRKFYSFLNFKIAKYYYDVWKFDVSFYSIEDETAFDFIFDRFAPYKSSVYIRCFLVSVWYDFSVFISMFYLMEPLLFSSIVSLLVFVLIYFKLYLLIYLLLFFVNSGKLVAGLAFSDYSNFTELRKGIFNGLKYGIKFNGWSFYFLRHRYLFPIILRKAHESVSEFVENIKQTMPITREDFNRTIFTEWFYHCYENDSNPPRPESGDIFQAQWFDEKKEENSSFFVEFDRYSSLGSLLYIFYWLFIIYYMTSKFVF